jgi:hypothetical protein
MGAAADLAPPPEGRGVQLRMVSTLAAGVETERCRFFKVPDAGYVMNRSEVRYSAGSHHILLFSTPYKEIPTVDLFGNTVDTSSVFECGKEGPTGHWSIDGVVAGAQKPDAPTIVEGLPPDTAFLIPGGSVLLMNTHYLNASDQPIETDARINLGFIPREQVKQEAGVLFFYNPMIYLPPYSTRTARMVCPILKDIHVVNAQSHMHKRGVDYVANLVNPIDMSTLTDIYATKEWDDVVMRRFRPHLPIKAGLLVDFKCSYANRGSREIVQGLTTEDEMCMMIGLYYPRDRRTEQCGLDDRFKSATFGGAWFGDGTKNGAETAACLRNAKVIDEDRGASFYACVTDSCPTIGLKMSDAARCFITNAFDDCESECTKAKDPAACHACRMPKCSKALQALQDARCE